MQSSVKADLVTSLERQIERLERRIKVMRAANERYSWIRLTILAVGVLFFFLTQQLTIELVSWGVLISFFLGFAAAAYFHRQLKTRLLRHTIWQNIKRSHIARMHLDWDNIPQSPATPSDREHAFELDLNMAGKRSVHQLIDTSSTLESSNRLRTWLLSPELDPDALRSRQEIVKELVPLSLFRDKLALFGELASSERGKRWEGNPLLKWLEQPSNTSKLKVLTILLGALAISTLTLFILNLVAGIGSYWSLSFLIYFGGYLFLYKHISGLNENADHLARSLNRLSAVLLFLERYPYGEHRRLAKLCEPFHAQRNRPSDYLKKINRIANAATAQTSGPIWLILNALVPWDFYYAYRLSHYKDKLRPHLPEWLDTWYELEALNALANFAYLNPGYTFPDIQPLSGSTPLLSARGLGHPLLPDKKGVCNDITVSSIGEISIVTGSNMSGKSTFLRTIGVNLCLTFAGGPVDASFFQTVPLRLFTCIKVSDSVNDGISYFYAEVKTLKGLLDLFETDAPQPVCFLIDEIFKGTNNRERLIGSRSYIKALAGRHGIGFVSTHDLELVKLSEELPRILNYHFREDVHEGKMVFDYKLRTGPCPTTNALKIMKMAGLPTDFENTND
ncbi:MAG: hypothetical protein HGB19_04665 [Chlorobiales bacterium]|nr:hypothetical protein [Chlorobiales bacterium]